MAFLRLPPIRRLGAVLAISGLAAILGLTLFPNPSQAARSAATPLLCLACGYQGGADIILNFLLFTPLGAGLRLVGWSWRRVVAAAALLSFTVESLQLTVIPGRDPTLSDLLTNTAGAAAAAALAPHLPRALAPDPALARRLFPGALAGWLGILGASALALQPSVLGGPIRNVCSAGPRAPDVFSGTVRSVVLNGIIIPCNAEVDDSAVRAALARGEATLDVTVLSGDAAGGRALLQTIRVDRGYLVLTAQEGRSVVLSMPSAGQHLELYPPLLRLPDAFPERSGIPVKLRGGARDRRIWMTAEHAGGRAGVAVALSPSHGWSTLLPWGIQLGPKLRLITALWVGGLIFPAAYWAGRLGNRMAGLVGVLAALAAGLGVLPALTGFPPVHWTEWLGGALGALLAWAVPPLAAYLQSPCGSPSTGAYSSP